MTRPGGKAPGIKCVRGPPCEGRSSALRCGACPAEGVAEDRGKRAEAQGKAFPMNDDRQSGSGLFVVHDVVEMTQLTCCKSSFSDFPR